MFLKSLFEKFAKIWFWYKKAIVFLDLYAENYAWSYIYYKTPIGSEREKLAFGEAIKLWAQENDKAKKAYPDYSPPNMLRKYGFGIMFSYSHRDSVLNAFASTDCFCNRIEPSWSVKKEIDLLKKKSTLWQEFIFSIPDSQEEKIILQKLKELGEVFPRSAIGNYSITIE